MDKTEFLLSFWHLNLEDWQATILSPIEVIVRDTLPTQVSNVSPNIHQIFMCYCLYLPNIATISPLKGRCYIFQANFISEKIQNYTQYKYGCNYIANSSKQNRTSGFFACKFLLEITRK